MQALLILAVALTVATVVFGIAVLLTGDRDGLRPVEPDSRAVPLPVDRPLVEQDLGRVRFDTAVRGYRMAQVDAALRRAAYDIGYKDELIKVLQAEIAALREGRFPDAEVLRRARDAAATPGTAGDPAAVIVAADVAGGEPAAEGPGGEPAADVAGGEPAAEGPGETGPHGGTARSGEAMPGGMPASGRR